MRCSALSALACALVIACFAPRSLAQSTLGPGFTYQGQLQQSGTPMNGTVNLRFSLWDAPGLGTPPAGGNQVGISQQLTGVPVTSGLFSVTLNAANQFGAAPFSGQARFLQIEVCADAVCTAATTLSPRQPLAATPYAAYAAAPWARPAGGTAISYSGGNVGVGLTNPSATLHVSGNLGIGVANIPAGLTSELGGTSTPLLNLDMNLRHPNRNTSLVGGAIRIDARNDTADPLFQFISRPPGSSTESFIATLSPGSVALTPTSGGTLTVGTGGVILSERLTINSPSFSPANLRINGATADSIEFALSGHTRVGRIFYYFGGFPGASDQLQFTNDNGNGHGVTGLAELQDDGSWFQSSDRQLKTDIEPAQGLLAKALALRPAEFFMKGQDLEHDPNKHLGLIAQEVQPILPSLVHAGESLTLGYDRIGVVAIGAIQEQQRIITEQQQQIDRLTARLQHLESLLAHAAPPAPAHQ